MRPNQLQLDAPRILTTRAKRALAAVALLGAALAVFGHDIVRMISAMAADPVISRAVSGGMLATALGTLPVLFARPLSARTQSAMLGFGAGVMLAATAFSLIIPGIDATRTLWNDPWIVSGVMVAGILAGGGALLWLDGRLPHESTA